MRTCTSETGFFTVACVPEIRKDKGQCTQTVVYPGDQRFGGAIAVVVFRLVGSAGREELECWEAFNVEAVAQLALGVGIDLGNDQRRPASERWKEMKLVRKGVGKNGVLRSESLTMTTPLREIQPTRKYGSIELDKHVLLSVDHLVKVFFRKGDHSSCLPFTLLHCIVLRSPECIPPKSVS